MISILVHNRKIAAASIDSAWPGSIVDCFPHGSNTLVNWYDGPIPPKTEAEIIQAQDDYIPSPPKTYGFSPDGTKWEIKIDDNGNITTREVT